MARISDMIELFIKELLEDSDAVELQRNELASYFGCAPSQINYVLTTRFSLDRGYVITSRRGGGGSIQIIKVGMDEGSGLAELVSTRLAEEVSAKEAVDILIRLRDEGIITQREAAIMAAAMGNLPMVPRNVAGYVRTELLKNMLTTLVGSDENVV